MTTDRKRLLMVTASSPEIRHVRRSRVLDFYDVVCDLCPACEMPVLLPGFAVGTPIPRPTCRCHPRTTPMDGWIEAIFGPMFSGKTEELLRRVHRAAWGRQRVQVVVPRANTRWEGAVRSHAGATLEAHPCIAVTVAVPGVDLVIGEGVKVLCFDEGQFFDPRDLVRWVLYAASRGLRVIVAQGRAGAPWWWVGRVVAGCA